MSVKAQQRPRATLLQHLCVLGYRGFCFILRACDIRLVAVLGRLIGYFVWIALPSRRRIVARNFRIVVNPALRPNKLRPMVRRNIVRTSMNLACSLKTGMMTQKEMERCIHMEGADFFRENGMNGSTVISCIPHAGNWEVLARIRPYFSEVEHFGSMYRRMSNPLLEELVYRSRTSHGCEMFSKEDGLRAVLRLARTGGLLGVLSDQFTQEGLFLPYFGKVTGVTPLPAILYKRCKGKASLFSVFTRNTALGKWDAILGRKIELPENCESLAAITMHVNLALEQCQKENILDGFWMHHRWKSTQIFAPQQDKDISQIAQKYTQLPFRIIVCLPESFDEAIFLLPSLRVLKASRHDVQLTILCPTEQQAFWDQQKDIIAYTATTDGSISLTQQLNSDHLYQDGPYDYLFMFSENRGVFRQLRRSLSPIFISGFRENKLSKNFRCQGTRLHTGAPWHISQDYLHFLNNNHQLSIGPDIYTPLTSKGKRKGVMISPFSTLGKCESWSENNWRELIYRLPEKTTLLALKQDRQRAEEMAANLKIDLLCIQPEDLGQMIHPSVILYAVDGLIAQLAALYGIHTTVIMASRQAERYRPMGSTVRTVYRHTPCYPCYRQQCDADTPCVTQISVDDVLNPR